MKLLKGLAVLSVASALSAAQAADVFYYVECPVSNTWMTASTYGPRGLVANTVINGWSFSNSGNPISVYRWDEGNGRCIYELVVHNVAVGGPYGAIVRQNNTGILRYTGTAYVTNYYGTYGLGVVRF